MCDRGPMGEKGCVEGGKCSKFASVRIWIADYKWFVKESQHFMQGVYPKPIIFILSLVKGFGFCKQMKENRM